MFAILAVLLLGTGLNVANDHPHDYADVKAALIKQVESPVIVADFSNVNE